MMLKGTGTRGGTDDKVRGILRRQRKVRGKREDKTRGNEKKTARGRGRGSSTHDKEEEINKKRGRK